MKNKMKLFYFDVETVGLDYRKHSIIQLSGMVEIDGIVVEEFDFKMRPHENSLIDENALLINKKSKDEILKYPKYEKQYKELKRLLLRHIDPYDRTDKLFLVGYNNSSFDNSFLRKFFELNGDSFFNSYFHSNSLDVMILAGQYLAIERHLMPNFKLMSVAKWLGIEVRKEDLHDALYDTVLTREIFKIVSGVAIDSRKDFYFYKKDGILWKTFDRDSENSEFEIDHLEYLENLFLLGLRDSVEFIKDNIF